MSSQSSLVFTTAYDEYALQAFRYNGLAYLMKPIDAMELKNAIDRIHKMQFPQQDILQLIQQMQQHQMKYRERFLVPYKDGFEVIGVNEVSHICTEFRDTQLCLKSGKEI